MQKLLRKSTLKYFTISAECTTAKRNVVIIRAMTFEAAQLV